MLALHSATHAVAQPQRAANVLDQQLLSAADDMSVAGVRDSLENGAHIEARGRNGSTALILATERGSADIVKLLLDRGANANARDRSGDTALVEAARSGNNELLELLLKVSDSRNKNLALFAAATGGPVVIVMEDQPAGALVTGPPMEAPWIKTNRLLLESGADLETRDPLQGTPLMVAASHGQTDIFEFLLNRGASIHARDKYGNTALILAACECAAATMNSTYDIVKMLLIKGANPNAQANDGTTALMNAAGGFGGSAIVELLLNSGADPAAKNKKGNTALSLAIKANQPDKIEILKRVAAHRH